MALERCRDRWNPKELAELARQLREFAGIHLTARKAARKRSKRK
jgi:hypothetical protein